jgi:succinate dehydrogenase/fumarate reductase flavoprotein subunit
LTDQVTYDVVVIGAGGAGMAAALFSAIEGLSVLLVERTTHLGGTTAYSSGTAWIPNTHHSLIAGAEDSMERAATFLRQAGSGSSQELQRAFLENGPQAIACIERNSEVKFRARALHPDYTQEAEGAALRGRALEPLPFDGRRLGGRFDLIRPPIPEFTVLGGLMVDRDDVAHLLKASKSWASFRHSVALVTGYFRDRMRYPRGTRLVMGNALIGRLLFSLDQRGVKIVLDADVKELRRPQGRTTDLVIDVGHVRRLVRARRGVILATGGFNLHKTRRSEMLPATGPIYSLVAPGNTGAMHDLVLAAGACYGEIGLDTVFWAPVSTRQRVDGSTAAFPHFAQDRGKPGTMVVNKAGRRFVNGSHFISFVRSCDVQIERDHPINSVISDRRQRCVA